MRINDDKKRQLKRGLGALLIGALCCTQAACSLTGSSYAGFYQGTSTSTTTVDGKSTTAVNPGGVYLLDGTESDLVIVTDDDFSLCPIKANFDGDKFESAKKTRCTIMGDGFTLTGTLEVEGEVVDGELELETTFTGTASTTNGSVSYLIVEKLDAKRQ